MSDWMALGAAGAFAAMTWAIVARFKALRPNRETTFALEFAAFDAIRRRSPALTIDHLAYALLFDPTIAAIVRGAGADPGAIRARLDEHLGAPPDAGTPLVEAAPDESLILVYASTIERRRSAPPEALLGFVTLGPTSLARDLLPERTALERARPRRRPQLVDCERASTSPYRGGRGFSGDTQIRLFDDDKTTLEHVVATLTTTFDLSEPCAVYVARRIDAFGSAAIGPWPRAEAEKLLVKARDDARAAGFPLRLELGPAA